MLHVGIPVLAQPTAVARDEPREKCSHNTLHDPTHATTCGPYSTHQPSYTRCRVSQWLRPWDSLPAYCRSQSLEARSRRRAQREKPDPIDVIIPLVRPGSYPFASQGTSRPLTSGLGRRMFHLPFLVFPVVLSKVNHLANSGVVRPQVRCTDDTSVSAERKTPQPRRL